MTIMIQAVEETDTSRLELLNDGIVRQSYKEGSVIDLAEAQHVLGLVREMVGSDTKIKLLNDMRSKVAFSRDARNYFKDNAGDDTIMAFLIDSKIGEVGVNFFLKFNKPAFSLRIFSNEDEAMQWLQSHP